MSTKKLTLQILASDILETTYSDWQDCAITRALKRAGFPNYSDEGTRISNDETNEIIVSNSNEVYEEMSKRVVRMYRRKRGYFSEHSEEVVDFEVTIELN